MGAASGDSAAGWFVLWKHLKEFHWNPRHVQEVFIGCGDSFPCPAECPSVCVCARLHAWSVAHAPPPPSWDQRLAGFWLTRYLVSRKKSLNAATVGQKLRYVAPLWTVLDPTHFARPRSEQDPDRKRQAQQAIGFSLSHQIASAESADSTACAVLQYDRAHRITSVER